MSSQDGAFQEFYSAARKYLCKNKTRIEVVSGKNQEESQLWQWVWLSWKDPAQVFYADANFWDPKRVQSEVGLDFAA